MVIIAENQTKETAKDLTETVELRQDAMHRSPSRKQSHLGFSDEWKSKRIGEVFQFLSTANNPRSDLSNHGEIGYIHYGDIHGSLSSFLDCSKKTMPHIDLQKVKNLPFLEEGDLVIADASEDYEGIGKSFEILNLNNKKIVAGLHTFLLRGNKNIVVDGFKGYIQYIPSLRTDMVRLATGISVYGISKNNLRRVEVKLPPIHEQTAIANILSDIDTLIASIHQLIAKKRNIKLAVMQQLLTGKQRLPGFNGEWGLKRIGVIFDFLSTANNPRSDLSDHGEIGYIHYGDIHGSSSSFFNCSKESMPYIDQLKVKNLPFLEEGDLVIADASEDYEGIGKSVEILNLNNKRIVAGLHTFLLRGNKSIIADGFKGYLQYIPSLRRDLVRLATGISVYGISKKNIRDIEVKLPSIPEQIAIAKVFSDMDTELSALEQQLDKTRNLKQGMMQELLTGRIRLI